MPTPKQGYFLEDGTRVPGTTTIIGGCKIGGIEPLLSWANRLGQEGKNHREERDKAADAGTCAHDMVECFIRNKDFDPAGYKEDALEKAKPAYEAFLEWADQTKLTPKYTEMQLVSEEYRYGGTPDSMLINGKLALGDWKTSGGVYPDFLIQLAAYGNLWEENFPDYPIDGGFHLARFAKPDHPDDPVHFSHHYWANLDLAWDAFKHMRELYELSKRLKKMV